MTDHTEKRCRDCDGYNCDNGCAYPPRDTEMQIPRDILEAATMTVAEMMKDPRLAMAPIIARAILQERERCARIAEDVPFILRKIRYVDK